MNRLKLTIVLWVLLVAAFPAAAVERLIETETGAIRVETFASGLAHPWGVAFLPDGRMLVTERPGRLRIVSTEGQVSEPLSGLPKIDVAGQGGLLDVAIDPDFASNGLVYVTYAEAGEGGASTAVARGKLAGGGLENVEVIFRQKPKVGGSNHFGSRLAFAPDGTLFVTLGERFKFDPAQDNTNHMGTVVRINPDGSVPPDNPFVGRSDALPEIWSYGHRNVQGADIEPGTGTLWTIEFGPLGGDELNRPEPGRNYGWPLVSWGKHYNGKEIPDPPTRPDLADAVRHWVPAISPSGMSFYDGALFPAWRGDLLIGGLSSRALVRLNMENGQVAGEERIDMGARVRDVQPGPDGAVYLLIDRSDGEILRVTPAGGAKP
jgi:glucose/arabinose dehydrogenase